MAASCGPGAREHPTTMYKKEKEKKNARKKECSELQALLHPLYESLLLLQTQYYYYKLLLLLLLHFLQLPPNAVPISFIIKKNVHWFEVREAAAAAGATTAATAGGHKS